MKSRKTILFVEDLSHESDLICLYLNENGYRVIKAIKPKDALEKAISQQPCVIITNAVVSGMSGYTLCRQLKTNIATQHLPIIICSSKHQSIDRMWGMRQGADIYLAKPYSCQQLFTAVESLLTQTSF